MKSLRSISTLILFSIVILVSPIRDVLAQNYPTKLIRFIVVFAPGGGTDILARAIGQKLGETWGQRVVVDNRPGASGMVGTELAAKSPPDGYTIVMVSASHAINPALYSKMAFDTVKDFTPVSLVAYVANILVVHPSVPVSSVKDLIQFAKANPGRLNYSSAGKGSAIHLATELFMGMTGTKMTHVPFKGGGQAIVDLLGGQVDLMFDNILTSYPHVKGGKLRALAVTTAKRSPAMPELPTVAEVAVPGYEFTSWFGILAPAGTPPDLVGKLNAEIANILKKPDMVERLKQLGAEAVGSTPQEFSTHIQAEMSKWAKVVRESGSKID